MFWKSFFGHKSTNKEQSTSSSHETNWLPSVNNEIVALWHNPTGKRAEEALLNKVEVLRNVAEVHRVGQRDPMVEMDTLSLPVVEILFRKHLIRVRCVIDELLCGRLKHLVVEFADDADVEPLSLLNASIEVALAVEPQVPGFYGISLEKGKQLGHVFWPVDWSQANILMPPGLGPYWMNPFRIGRNGESYSLDVNNELNKKLENISIDTSQAHFLTISLLTLVLKYLDRQQNWDLLLLSQTELWSDCWSMPFRNLLASVGNHRLWDCRACGANYIPDVQLTRDLLEVVVDEPRHSSLPISFLPGFSTSDAACWPITESLLFCQIAYNCPTCSNTFDRKIFIETLPSDYDVTPDLVNTDTCLHLCAGLQINKLNNGPEMDARISKQDNISDNPSISEKITEVVSNLPSKEQLDEHNDLNTWDVNGLLDALKNGNRTRKLIAIEKLAWSLYGDEASRVEAVLVRAMKDTDKFVAIRSAKTLLMEGGAGDRQRYKEHVLVASEDSSIDEGIQSSFKAMIEMNDNLGEK